MLAADPHRRLAPLAMARLGWGPCIVATCTWLLAWGCLLTARAESLSRCVPADVGLCIELLNLSHADAAQVDREVLTRLAHFPPLLDPNLLGSIDRLRGFVGRLAPRLATTPEKLWSQIFGTSVAVAVWPDDRAQGRLGQVVLLFECSDSELLERVVRALVEPSSQAKGNVPLPSEEHAGHTYHVRSDAHRADAPSVFAAAVGSVGIITGERHLLHRTIELIDAAQTPAADAAAPPQPLDRLADLSAYQQSQTRIPSTASVRLFISPRAWDESFRAATQDAPGFVAGSLLSAWQALDYISLGISPSEVLSVDTWVHYRTAELPPALAKLVKSMDGPVAFLNRVPDDAIVALAGRVNLQHLSEMLFPVDAALPVNGKPITQDIAQGLALGTRLFSSLLPQLGPDVGAFLARQSTDEPSVGLPFAWVVGVQTSPQAAAAVDQSIAAVMSLLGDLQRSETASPAAHPMQSEFQGVTLTSIADLAALPRGVEPTYAVTDGYVFAATCPKAVQRVIAPAAGSTLVDSPQFLRLLNPQLAEPSHYFYLDCAALRQLLADFPNEFRALVTAFRGLTPETATRSLSQLRELLNLCDTLLVSAKFEPDGLVTSLRMSVESPPGEGAAPTGRPSSP